MRFVLCALLFASTNALCRPSTLPTAGYSLNCFLGTTGGTSTGSALPTASTSPAGNPGEPYYCISYTKACDSSDSGSPACQGNAVAMGALYRQFTLVPANNAAIVLTGTTRDSALCVPVR